MGSKQMHTAYIMAHAPLKIPERQRPAPYADGSNLGDCISGIDMPDLPGNEWLVDYQDKKQAYGPNQYKASGNPWY